MLLKPTWTRGGGLLIRLVFVEEGPAVCLQTPAVSAHDCVTQVNKTSTQEMPERADG